MEVVVITGRAKLQSNHYLRQTNTQFFYKPDALPVTHPTVSKHWREICLFHSNNIAGSALVLRRCWLGDRKCIWPVERWVLVCWWWLFNWSFARPIAPVFTTTSIIFSYIYKYKTGWSWFTWKMADKTKRAALVALLSIILVVIPVLWCCCGGLINTSKILCMDVDKNSFFWTC